MESKPHITTLVVDYDDTIATTFNRDWENAEPNQPLIDRLNELYDQGWTIHIVTARGQLSCNGDCDAADKKYRAQIERWLDNHCVKYTDLSFQKKLAAYYIDDKGITPDDFVEKFQRTQLKGGWSGATVYYDKMSDAVYKTAPNSISAVEWYKAAHTLGVLVPKVHSLIGTTIKMECLPQYTGSVESILDVIQRFNNYPPLHSVEPQTYVNRCLDRVANVLEKETYDTLHDALNAIMPKTKATFSHGDLSYTNVMGCRCSSSMPCLIDPINDPSLYSSFYIDYAKLYMSYGLVGNSYMQSLVRTLSFIPQDMLSIHELGHLCRVYPYAGSEQTRILELIHTKTNALG